MYKVVYGIDTGSIEDFAQCVILDVPNHIYDLDDWLADNDWTDLPYVMLADLIK